MRLVPFLCVLACACTAEDPLLLAEDVDSVYWRGAFEEGSGTCRAGSVALEVQQADDGWFEGTYHYENDHGHIFYEVAGQLDDAGLLVLDQLDSLEASQLPEGRRWCMGTMELALDRWSGGIGGGWESQMCECAGSVTLERS